MFCIVNNIKRGHITLRHYDEYLKACMYSYVNFWSIVKLQLNILNEIHYMLSIVIDIEQISIMYGKCNSFKSKN